MMRHPSHFGPAPSIHALAARLQKSSRKLTRPRKAVLEVLRAAAHPLSTRQILAELGPCECDLATVYRSMHLLEQVGLVKRFDLGDGSARFELLREGDDGHHHHLVCTRCSEVVEINECATADLERRIAADSGFKSITHKLEFFGICPSCQEK